MTPIEVTLRALVARAGLAWSDSLTLREVVRGVAIAYGVTDGRRDACGCRAEPNSAGLCLEHSPNDRDPCLCACHLATMPAGKLSADG